MAAVGEDLEFFRFLTINTLYNPMRVIGSGTFWWQFVVLGAIGFLLYAFSIKIFKEKDLPL